MYNLVSRSQPQRVVQKFAPLILLEHKAFFSCQKSISAIGQKRPKESSKEAGRDEKPNFIRDPSLFDSLVQLTIIAERIQKCVTNYASYSRDSLDLISRLGFVQAHILGCQYFGTQILHRITQNAAWLVLREYIVSCALTFRTHIRFDVCLNFGAWLETETSLLSFRWATAIFGCQKGSSRRIL